MEPWRSGLYEGLSPRRLGFVFFLVWLTLETKNTGSKVNRVIISDSILTLFSEAPGHIYRKICWIIFQNKTDRSLLVVCVTPESSGSIKVLRFKPDL